MCRGLALGCTPPTVHEKYSFFPYISIIYDPTHLRLGGTKKKLLPSSYSDGAPKMCNICVCKYCAHICFKAICILLIFDKNKILIQIEQIKPWSIIIRRVGWFDKKKEPIWRWQKNVLIFVCKLCAEVLL